MSLPNGGDYARLQLQEKEEENDRAREATQDRTLYMLETMDLNPTHRFWVEDQLEDLEGK